MKIIPAIAFFIMILATAFMGYIVGRYQEQQRYDMPEEMKAISKTQFKPDTMVVWQDDGKYHFWFK